MSRWVGWFAVRWRWPTRKVGCNACGRKVREGVVRAGNSDPRRYGFMVLCLDCGLPMLTTAPPGTRHGDKLQPPRHWSRGN